MRVLKIILIVLIFVSLIVGALFAFLPKLFISKSKNTNEVAERKVLRNKMIGYVLMMLSFAFAIFQSLIEV